MDADGLLMETVDSVTQFARARDLELEWRLHKYWLDMRVGSRARQVHVTCCVDGDDVYVLLQRGGDR